LTGDAGDNPNGISGWDLWALFGRIVAATIAYQDLNWSYIETANNRMHQTRDRVLMNLDVRRTPSVMIFLAMWDFAHVWP